MASCRQHFEKNPNAKRNAAIAVGVVLILLTVFLLVYFLVIAKQSPATPLCWAWKDDPKCIDPCEEYKDCYDCLVAGCLFCAGENLCMNAPSRSQADAFWNELEAASTPFRAINQCTIRDAWTQKYDATACPHVYNDPSYDRLQSQYQLIRVEQVWRQNITGYGVHVRVNEPTLDPHHVEFQDYMLDNRFVTKWDAAHSCQEYPAVTLSKDANNETDLDVHYDAIHGTSMLSMIAADASNDQCAVGIAPGATLSGCSFGKLATDDDMADMLESMTDTIDISSNSWGVNVCSYSCRPMCLVGTLWPMECSFYDMTPRVHDILEQGVTNGRNGKGIVYVFAAGNGDKYNIDDVNMMGFVNSRYTISVGAVDDRGTYMTFSNTGAALTVTAPAAGAAVAEPGGGCHTFGIGTSFATAVVSGVLALVLEAAPWLTWRDVQGILATTSRSGYRGYDPYGSQQIYWATNGAGLNHSYQYGFGVIDAAAAVEAAQTWHNYGPEREWSYESGEIDLYIPDDPNQHVSSFVSVELSPVNADFSVESVVVALDLQHEARGQLQIVLTAPSGMESILLPGDRNENRQFPDGHMWELTTLRHWGESPAGQWNLTLTDLTPGGEGNCSNNLYSYARLDNTTGEVLKPYYDCREIENKRFCADGAVLNATYVVTLTDANRGSTPAEACCVCGGGTNVTKNNTLRSWTLYVYGHEYVEDPTAT